MKLLLRKITFVVIGILVFGVANAGTLPDKLALALSTGNSSEISNYFNSSIEFSLLGTDDIYSKTQAEQILSNFFDKNSPRSFNEMHAGGKPDAKFVIGSLKTSNGTFRISLFFKGTGDTIKIHQLRIEKDERF